MPTDYDDNSRVNEIVDITEKSTNIIVEPLESSTPILLTFLVGLLVTLLMS